MLNAGLLDYADCVGAHHNGYNTPPDVPYDRVGEFPEVETAQFRGPYDDPRPFWSFYSTLNRYAERVAQADPSMKLCVTEFGWASSEGYDAVPAGFEFALDNTLQEQADYIVQAFQSDARLWRCVAGILVQLRFWQQRKRTYRRPGTLQHRRHERHSPPRVRGSRCHGKATLIEGSGNHHWYQERGS